MYGCFVCYSEIFLLQFGYSGYLLEKITSYDSDVCTTVDDTLHRYTMQINVGILVLTTCILDTNRIDLGASLSIRTKIVQGS